MSQVSWGLVSTADINRLASAERGAAVDLSRS
jgi:hypothetical protein